MKARISKGSLLFAMLVALASPVAAGAYEPHGEYLDFADQPPIADGSSISWDPEGIPRVLYGDDGPYYNPVTISQWGLQEYSFYARDGGDEHLERATRAAGWLVDEQDPDTGGWLYQFEWQPAGTNQILEAPWMSAMAQGEAMSLLTRLHGITGNNTYLTAAEAALAPLEKPVSEDGLTATYEGHLFFEEYPTSPPTYVLNGFMFTLFGLYDLGQAGVPKAADLYQQGIETLEYLLPLYDQSPGLSAYSLGHIADPSRPLVTGEHYHWIHVVQLDALNTISPSETFRGYRNLWSQYGKQPATPQPPVQPTPTQPAPPPLAPPVEPTVAPAPHVKERPKPKVSRRKPCIVPLRRWRQKHKRRALVWYWRCRARQRPCRRLVRQWRQTDSRRFLRAHRRHCRPPKDSPARTRYRPTTSS